MAPNYRRDNPKPEGQAGTPAQRKTRGTEGRQALARSAKEKKKTKATYLPTYLS
jgi:hypothetical protein